MAAPGPPENGRNGPEGYRFGAFALDPVAYTLVRDGVAQSLEPKALAVLLHLLRHAGELVRHDELLDAVWGHRHVTPGVLTRCIAQLRHVLEDDPHRPQYIQTQHGLGYRFIGELQPAPCTAGAPGSAPAPDAPSPGGAEPAAVPGPAPDPAPGPAPDPRLAPVLDAGMAGPAAASAPPLRWRRFAVAAALLVAIFAWSLYRTDGSAPPRPRDASIAVLPFTTLSDTRTDGYFAEGLAIELHDALAGVRGLKVASCRAESACGTRGADVRRIGKLLGVATVLDADVRREGQRVRINARLSDTETGYTLWSGSYDRELTGVFALQRDIAAEVVRSLPGIGAGSSESLARRLQPTRSIAAYDAYLRGVHELDGRRDGATALAFFNEALAADTGFARAQAGACRAGIVAFENTREAAAYDRAEAACRRAAEMDPTLREVSLALGDLHQARSEPARAMGYYRQALADHALRPDAYLGMARAAAAQQQTGTALEYFERARQLRPGDPAVYRALGFHHYVSGDLRKGIEHYRVATELEPNDEETWAGYGGLCLLAGDTDCASDAFMRSLSIRPSYGALVNLGALRFDQREYAEAATLFRRATELNPSDYRSWGNLGDALAARKETAAQARDAYARAAQMTQAYIDLKPQDAHAIAVLAWYRANLGQADVARDLIRRAEALGVEKGEVAYFTAQASALLGDSSGARRRIQSALDGGILRQRLEATPVLRRLVAEPTLASTEAE